MCTETAETSRFSPRRRKRRDKRLIFFSPQTASQSGYRVKEPAKWRNDAENNPFEPKGGIRSSFFPRQNKSPLFSDLMARPAPLSIGPLASNAASIWSKSYLS